MSRYSRHIVLSEIGHIGQEKLSKAKVLVIGAGGLGCPVLQYLTAAGIGTIGVIDHDTVEVSNLQRQILFGTSSLGLNKALAAKRRLEDLNPTITIHAYPEKLTHSNAKSYFEAYDIIVDGTDNFETRYLISDMAIIQNKPVVYAAIFKFEGQVSVFNYQNGPSYRCVFPNPPNEGSVSNCSEVGVLGVLPGIIGSMQANEVLKIILDFGYILSGKILCFNSKTSETAIIKVSKSETAFSKALNKDASLQNDYIHTSCPTETSHISIKDALKLTNTEFIDVREIHEQPKLDTLNHLQIPLRELEQKITEINTDKTSIIFCQSGIRSQQAIGLLRKHNIQNSYSLREGVSKLIEELNIKA
ncbi:dinucleotide-utilizing protein [Flavobacteriales bacterium 34_180_T64]|nr:dinucleotide-utilizing protein [Flavobacteriales bacterium 34_180_T64]